MMASILQMPKMLIICQMFSVFFTIDTAVIQVQCDLK